MFENRLDTLLLQFWLYLYTQKNEHLERRWKHIQFTLSKPLNCNVMLMSIKTNIKKLSKNFTPIKNVYFQVVINEFNYVYKENLFSNYKCMIWNIETNFSNFKTWIVVSTHRNKTRSMQLPKINSNQN